MGHVQDRLPNGCLLQLWTEDDDLIPNEVFWKGWNGFESETLPLFFRLAGRARVTLDVGAHIGLFALLAAHASSAGRVYAFEAMPAIARRLVLNVELNGLTNVECIACAVDDREGAAAFFYSTGLGLPAESSLRRECTEAFLHFSTVGEIRETRVPVVTLDGFVRERGLLHVDLVKLDTEGTEPRVLRGMADTMRRDHPALVCEVVRGFETEGELEAILAANGYRYYLLTPEGPVQRARIDPQPEDQWQLRNWLFSTLPVKEVTAA
jgi:FkbM family methyltransferase